MNDMGWPGTFESAAGVIKAARDSLTTAWCKGTLEDECNRHCIEGALAFWATGVAYTYPRDSPLLWESRVLVEAHLPADVCDIPSFNDAEDTSLEDVLTVLDKTLADLGAL